MCFFSLFVKNKGWAISGDFISARNMMSKFFGKFTGLENRLLPALEEDQVIVKRNSTREVVSRNPKGSSSSIFLLLFYQVRQSSIFNGVSLVQWEPPADLFSFRFCLLPRLQIKL